MSAAAQSTSFEATLQELERIVAAMEAGDVPLEEALANYERGVVLLKHCQAQLGNAEQRIRILEDGELHDFTSPGDATES